VDVVDTSAAAETTPEAPASAPDQTPAEETKQVPEIETPPKEERPKSPGFIAKILAPLKKAKVPRSPKKDKKKEESETTVPADAGVKEEAPVTASEPETEGSKTADVVKDTVVAEAAVAETVAEEKELKKEDKPKPAKINRRISTRIGDLFTGDLFKTKPKPDVASTAKVDEHPPKIDEPSPVPPLENPAPEPQAETSAVEAATPADVPVVTTPIVTASPAVAAAA